MQRELPSRPRFLVRLPRKSILGHALEKFPSDGNLFLKLREQDVGK
jgi:hypothetical protein